MAKSRLLVVVAVHLVVLLSASHVLAQAPKFIRLSVSNPSDTTMTITWTTDIDTPTEVVYGDTPGSLDFRAEGTSFRSVGDLEFIHEVQVTDLEPDTTYHYLVGSESTGFSLENTFHTGPAQDQDCGSFSFGVLADNRPDPTFGGGENYPQILSELALRGPDFILNGGDMVIDGDEIDQWVDFLGWTTDISADIPFMPTLGNHDDGPGEGDEAYYNQIFSLPRSEGANSSGTEDYYFFTYGNAIFVSLSTESFSGGDIPFAEQAAWLDRVLTENPRRWKFVFIHKPIYTFEAAFSISHEPNEENQNAAFVPVIDRHHVDVVFASHNHWYERYEPSNCSDSGRPGSDSSCSVGAENYADGTVYVITGGAGAFTIPEILCQGFTPVQGRVACRDPHHYVTVSIEDDTLSFEAREALGETGLMDSFTITKPGVDCAPEPEPEPEPAPEPEAESGDEPDAGSADGAVAEPEPDAGSSEEDVHEEVESDVPTRRGDDTGTTTENEAAATTPDEGCGCAATSAGSGLWILGLFPAFAIFRRRRLRR